jgi:hypothetical protein
MTNTVDVLANPSSILQQLFASGAVQQQAFDPQSRYYGLPITTVQTAGGEELSYVSRRFIPPPSAFRLLQRYRVRQGDRIDVIAASLVGDPLRYWQVCDANLAQDPDDVTATPGAFIAITLPAGLPGA